MSEPTNTEVQGDVNGSALSGSFSGPVQTGQNVVVNIQRVIPDEIPPEFNNVTMRQWMAGVLNSLVGVEDKVYSLSKEVRDVVIQNARNDEARLIRQEVYDEDQHEAKEERFRMRQLIRFTLAVAILGVVIGIINFFVTQQIITRLGWLW